MAITGISWFLSHLCLNMNGSKKAGINTFSRFLSWTIPNFRPQKFAYHTLWVDTYQQKILYTGNYCKPGSTKFNRIDIFNHCMVSNFLEICSDHYRSKSNLIDLEHTSTSLI